MPLIVRRGIYLVLALAVTLGLGTTGFMWIEGASAFDSFYMALITMTTVGYAETVHLGHAGRVFNSFYLLISASLLFASIGVFTITLVELQLGDLLGQRKVRKMINSLDAHYIVCGLGRVGRGAAEELQRVVESSRLGQGLKVAIIRGEKTQTLTIKTGELQDAA